MIFDPWYFVYLAPAFLLMMFAQWRIKAAYHQTRQIPARVSGAQAASTILQANGLQDVGIEQVGGQLSDHYDPRHRVLRLSSEVYHGNSLASVGIAAHEVGHAIQHARHYLPLHIRNAAVPIANFGSGFGVGIIILGAILRLQPVIWLGIAAFCGVVFFQLVNLPVEFNASNRAKAELVRLGIIDQRELPFVRKVLNAAALTYVAATAQSIMILLYYAIRLGGAGSRRDD